MNTINLQATIDTPIELKGTINTSTTTSNGEETGGLTIVNFIGAIGWGGTPTSTKVLIDVDGYILKDSNGSILKVTEGDENAWPMEVMNTEI